MHGRCCLQAASPEHCTISSKHRLVLLRMGEIIVRNMLSWLGLSINTIIVASSWLFVLLLLLLLLLLLYTTSCKHSLVLLRMGEIIARNMLSWLGLSINTIIVASSSLFILLYQWRTAAQTSNVLLCNDLRYLISTHSYSFWVFTCVSKFRHFYMWWLWIMGWVRKKKKNLLLPSSGFPTTRYMSYIADL
jgi:hypothetical protein